MLSSTIVPHTHFFSCPVDMSPYSFGISIWGFNSIKMRSAASLWNDTLCHMPWAAITCQGMWNSCAPALQELLFKKGKEAKGRVPCAATGWRSKPRYSGAPGRGGSAVTEQLQVTAWICLSPSLSPCRATKAPQGPVCGPASSRLTRAWAQHVTHRGAGTEIPRGFLWDNYTLEGNNWDVW